MGYRVVHSVCSAVGEGGGCSIKAGGVLCSTPGVQCCGTRVVGEGAWGMVHGALHMGARGTAHRNVVNRICQEPAPSRLMCVLLCVCVCGG